MSPGDTSATLAAFFFDAKKVTPWASFDLLSSRTLMSRIDHLEIKIATGVEFEGKKRSLWALRLDVFFWDVNKRHVFGCVFFTIQLLLPTKTHKKHVTNTIKKQHTYGMCL